MIIGLFEWQLSIKNLVVEFFLFFILFLSNFKSQKMLVLVFGHNFIFPITIKMNQLKFS